MKIFKSDKNIKIDNNIIDNENTITKVLQSIVRKKSFIEDEKTWETKEVLGDKIKVESTSEPNKTVLGCGYNSLAASAYECYSRHKRLILSPDIIWLNIIQQLAIHININSKKFKKQFVKFDDKKVLMIREDFFVKGEQNPWDQSFPKFTSQIKEHIGNKNYNNIITEFSTTTNVSKSATEIALMDVVKNYFDYGCSTRCGIPEIGLEGTKDDWKIIVQKVKKLENYDMKWWVDVLVPVLEKFTEVFDDKIDEKFWEAFFKEKNGSGGPYINGHILKLFAYKKNYQDRFEKELEWHSGWTTSNFTSGLSKVPFLWEYFNTMYAMDLYAGFIGIEQNKNSLKPNIGWAVSERKIKKEELDSEIKRFSTELKAQGDNITSKRFLKCI